MSRAQRAAAGVAIPMTPEHARYLKRCRRRTDLHSRRGAVSPQRLAELVSRPAAFSMVEDIDYVDRPYWDANGRRIITTVEKIRENDLKRERKKADGLKAVIGRKITAGIVNAFFAKKRGGR
jgi:hypothetical protein